MVVINMLRKRFAIVHHMKSFLSVYEIKSVETLTCHFKISHQPIPSAHPNLFSLIIFCVASFSYCSEDSHLCKFCSIINKLCVTGKNFSVLNLLHSKWPKLHRVLAILSAIELKFLGLFVMCEL